MPASSTRLPAKNARESNEAGTNRVRSYTRPVFRRGSTLQGEQDHGFPYGLTTVPSARRTVSHAPPNAYSLNGYLAANASSTSMPSPGFPLGHM